MDDSAVVGLDVALWEMPYVYLLRCADGSYYVGSTWQLDQRVWEHNAGLGGRFTAKRRPVELAYACWFDRVAEAYELERKIHNWSHAKKEALIAGDFPALSRLARSMSRLPSHEGVTSRRASRAMTSEIKRTPTEKPSALRVVRVAAG